MEFLARSLTAVLLVVLTFDTAYRLAWHWVRGGEVLLRWSAAGVIGMWLATVGFHALFALSIFEPWVALGGALVACCAARRITGAATTRALCAQDRAYLAGAIADPLVQSVLIVCAPFVLLLLARSLILPPMAWDWVTYHGLRAGLFAQGAGWTFPDAPGAWGLCRHYFAGSEVLAAWTLLPFHSDLLAGLADWVQWIALGIAVGAVGRRLGLGRRPAAVAALLVLFVPTVRLQVPSGYVELELAFAIAACAAFAMAFMRGAEPAHACLAFAAAGLAAGIKPNGALSGGALCATILVAASASRRHRPRRLIPSLALTVLLAVLPSLPWMALSVRDTGAPLSPMPVAVWDVPLGVASPEMELLMDQDTTGAYTWARERAALASVFGEPTESEAPGILALIPLCVFPFGVVAGWLCRRRIEVLAVLLTALPAAIFYYLPDLSFVRLDRPTSAPRYVIGAAVVAIPTSFLAFVRWPRWEAWYLRLILAAAAFYAVWYATFGMAAFEGAYLWRVWAYLALGVALAGSVGGRLHWTVVFATAMAFAAFGALQLEHARPAIRNEALQHSKQLHHINRYWVEALAMVDDGRTPHRIAVTAGTRQSCDHWFAYSFLGRNLQNRLVHVPAGADGRALHVASRTDPGPSPDRAGWLQRLFASGASEVLSFKPRSIEQGWMEADPERFERLAGDQDWGLFRVLR